MRCRSQTAGSVPCDVHGICCKPRFKQSLTSSRIVLTSFHGCAETGTGSKENAGIHVYTRPSHFSTPACRQSRRRHLLATSVTADVTFASASDALSAASISTTTLDTALTSTAYGQASASTPLLTQKADSSGSSNSLAIGLGVGLGKYSDP